MNAEEGEEITIALHGVKIAAKAWGPPDGERWSVPSPAPSRKFEITEALLTIEYANPSGYVFMAG